MKELTHVKIEFFKESGKFYSSFEFHTETSCSTIGNIVFEAKNNQCFIENMDFTIEVKQGHPWSWNKYLYKVID